MEVDSNHRSNLQQIYSLSPLATRESIHVKWDLQGSNLWPSACKADALPAELRSHITTQKRLELSTSAVTGRRSNQLSHWAKMDLRGLEPRTDRLWADCSNQLS